jgi:DNA-binding response OmpR family regulator
MSGDLFSLRMLFVAARKPGEVLWQPEHDYWRRGAAMATVPIEFSAHDAAAASVAISNGDVDICVLDSSLPPNEKAAVLSAARSAATPPVTFESATHGSRRTAGVDGGLPKPASADDARKLVELCARTKVPTRVLIVDDSRTMRGIVRKTLSASRFALEIAEADEGTAAIERLRGGSFGLVFLDYNMPGLNGFETLLKIRSTTPCVGVVIMTSTIDNVIADRAHASGALAFLKKPFYPADIDAILERFYGMHTPLS